MYCMIKFNEFKHQIQKKKPKKSSKMESAIHLLRIKFFMLLDLICHRIHSYRFNFISMWFFFHFSYRHGLHCMMSFYNWFDILSFHSLDLQSHDTDKTNFTWEKSSNYFSIAYSCLLGNSFIIFSFEFIMH